MKSALACRKKVDEYVGKEREAGRLLGLFSIKDCPEVHISPLE